MVGIIPLIWMIDRTNRETLSRKLWDTGGLKTTNSEMRAIAWRKIAPFVKTYLYYLTLCVFPFKSGIEHNYLRGFGTNEKDNLAGYKKDYQFYLGLLIFVTVTVWSGYCIFTGWNPVIWGLFWFTINIAMWCNFVTYQQQIAERYVYLANIGIMYALANLIVGYPYLIGAFISGYAVRTWFAMDSYINDWWAVEYCIREFKNLYYMWLMRGVKKFLDKDYMGAARDFNEAYLHKPYDLKVLYNLSSSLLVLGDVARSRELLELAKQNVYDELEDTVKPCFESLEAQIKIAEEFREKGQNTFSLDLGKIMMVK